MPTDVARALSLQQQRSLELTAAAAAAAAVAMLQSMTDALSKEEAKSLGDQYEILLLGAMSAAAATRVGYLQGYASAQGLTPFELPPGITRPTVQDVLVGGSGRVPAPEGVLPPVAPPVQVPVRTPSPQGGMWAALARLAQDIEQADALSQAAAELSDATEATVLGAADWVDTMVLGPSKSIVALRRVAHPGACDRCLRASNVLIFKSSPRPRHPQCRCSFEPVDAADSEYQARLARYRRNTQATGGGAGGSAWARQTRSRGRRQLNDAARREREFQEVWTQFLLDEQSRLSSLVSTVPSNTYRGWAIMTSANIAESVSNPLPLITRK